MTATWTSTSMPYLLPRAAGQTDAWTEESAEARGTQELLSVGEAEAPENVAEMLSLGTGDRAVARHRLMRVGDLPVELVSSYYPLPIAAGTALAEHRKIRGGTPTLLAELGHRTSRVVEDVESRTPTADEASTLGLDQEAPVLVLSRVTFRRDNQPVEASVMVMRSGRRLRYEIEVD